MGLVIMDFVQDNSSAVLLIIIIIHRGCGAVGLL